MILMSLFHFFKGTLPINKQGQDLGFDDQNHGRLQQRGHVDHLRRGTVRSSTIVVVH